MASAPVQHVQSVAQAEAGVDEDGTMTFDEAYAQVSGMKLTLTTLLKSDRRSTEGELGIKDLPFRQLQGTYMIQFADCVQNHEGVINFEQLCDIMSSGRYRMLPVPFRLKQTPAVPYTMQAVIFQNDPKDEHCKKHHILKHIIFQKDMKTTTRTEFMWRLSHHTTMACQ